MKRQNKQQNTKGASLFTHRSSLFTGLLLTLLCTASTAAQAERYRVDLILFQDKTGAGEESPLPPEAPGLKGALEPFDTVKLRAAGIEMLPDEKFGLMEHWKRLVNSQRHEPLLRLAWIQKDPPAEPGPRLRLRFGSPYTAITPSGGAGVYPVDGSVALLAGRFLHLDADLVHVQPGTDGELGGYRLKERRRLRRDELHHLDSPRIGLLVRAQRADVKTEPPKRAPSAPAPKAGPSKP